MTAMHVPARMASSNQPSSPTSRRDFQIQVLPHSLNTSSSVSGISTVSGGDATLVMATVWSAPPRTVQGTPKISGVKPPSVCFHFFVLCSTAHTRTCPLPSNEIDIAVLRKTSIPRFYALDAKTYPVVPVNPPPAPAASGQAPTS